MFSKCIAILVIAAGIAGTPTIAEADRHWSSVGNGCVPVDEDIQVNNYDSRGFGVGFKGVSTGDIRLTCPVSVSTTGSNPTFQFFTLSYKDPDGTGVQSRITANFRQVADGSNAATTICLADSNTSAATGNTTLTCNFTDFSPSQFVSYYVEIIISRTTTSLDPEFLAVSVLGI